MAVDHDNLISVSDAAKKIGIQKQSLFKVLNRFGVNTIKQKCSNHRGQAISYITEDDFELIVNNYSPENQSSGKSEHKSSSHIDHGVFYLIQLEPDHDPGRFKLGFATNIRERLRSHKTAAPFSRVLETWPCKSLWEQTAIDCITADCEKLHTEVFRATDLDEIKRKCNQFFAMMPDVSSQKREPNQSLDTNGDSAGASSP